MKKIKCYNYFMLKIKDLSYYVKEASGYEKIILKNINLSFEKGKIYAVTGPNGSGKSTLAKIIMGIIPQTTGDIFFDNKNINELSITERANLGLAFAFQKPATFKGITIRRLLDIASGKSNNVGNACDYLSTVGLCAKDYLARTFDDKLSGGEQKRIELALAIARNAKVNIFDEPEAGIDIWSFAKLNNLFNSLSSATNIIVSHQQKILEIADEVLLIENGEIKAQGPYKKMVKHLEKSMCKKLGGKYE